MSKNERDEIENEIADLAAIESVLGGRLAALRRAKAKLRKLSLEYDPELRLITDHALLRYMERHKGIDVEALRQELRSLAEKAEPAKDGEHYWHAETGVIMILGDAGQVVTVLSPEQAEKWAGRKLKNGTRIAAGGDEQET